VGGKALSASSDQCIDRGKGKRGWERGGKDWRDKKVGGVSVVGRMRRKEEGGDGRGSEGGDEQEGNGEG